MAFIRTLCVILATLGLALVAAACGDDASSGVSSAGSVSTATSAEDAAAPAFPVTIEHKFGSTTITEEPTRVLSLGFNEHDTILALGVTPVAARYWYGPKDDVIRPWADAAATGPDPQILEMPELNYEAIAALRPDVILGVYAGIKPDEYERLSQIAPTVPQPGEYVDYGAPWQVAVRTAGMALGRSPRAEELVGALEARFERVREEHPQFAGRSALVATFGGDKFGVFASEDPRARFFQSLGFTAPDEIDRLAGDSFYVDLSLEQAGLLDRDLLVWDQLQFVDGGRATIEALPLVKQLAATKEGRSIFLEGGVEEAFGWSTVLSLPFALDGVIPLLEEAVPAGAAPVGTSTTP